MLGETLSLTEHKVTLNSIGSWRWGIVTFLASSKNVKISLKLSVEDGEGEDSCFRLQHNLKAE